MDATDMARPEQKTFDELVLVPTIKVAEVIPGRPKEVVVQWFGETKSRHFDTFQFQFPVGLPVDNMNWLGHPEEFLVVFIGKICEWPKAEAVAEIAERVGQGDAEARVLWVTTSYYVLGSGNDLRAPTFIIPLNVMLADSIYGIITPRQFCDLEALEAVHRKIQEPRLTA